MKDELLESHVSVASHEFWSETYKESLVWLLEMTYTSDVVRAWHISNLVVNGDKILFKWQKRILPLNDEQLEKEYPAVYKTKK